MSREEVIPRGIRKITYKNGDGSETTSYRVRIVRSKEKFAVDRLLDTLDRAVEFLDECKTPSGRQRIMNGVDRANHTKQVIKIAAKAAAIGNPEIDKATITNAALADFIADTIGGKRKTVDDAIAAYLRKHVWPLVGKNRDGFFGDANGAPWSDSKNPQPVVRENIRESAKKRERMLKLIADVPLPYLPPDARKGKVVAVGGFHDIAQQHTGKMLRFGSWPLIHVTKQTGRDFIEARGGEYKDKKGRVKTRSVSTVQRDIVMMSIVFAQIEFSKELKNMWQVMGEHNPFRGVIDKGHLRGQIASKELTAKAEKRWRELNRDEEERLTAELIAYATREKHQTKTCSEPLAIFKLSLETGLRLSECVLLEHEYVDFETNSLWLPEEAAKGKARRVHLNDEARQIIAQLPRENHRLFQISVAGLRSMMTKAIERTGIPDLRWHDMRRTHFTRMINDDPTMTPLKIAHATGASDTRHIHEIIEKIEEDKAFKSGRLTERQIQKHGGHSGDRTITYNTRLPIRSNMSIEKPKASKPKARAKK